MTTSRALPGGANTTPALERADRFVAYVQRVIADPGTRAALRSSLGRPPERAVRAHAVVAPWVAEHTDPMTERAYYAVAALLAAGPRPAHGPMAVDPDDPQPVEQPRDPEQTTRRAGNLGDTLARAAQADVIQPEHAEARLHLLVRQGADGLHRHLPRVVRRLQDAGVPLDWGQLLVDLTGWTRSHDRVTRRWLQSYYRRLTPSPDIARTSPDPIPPAELGSEDQ